MSHRFEVDMITTASATVTVELSDEEYAAALTEYGIDPIDDGQVADDELIDALRDKIETRVYEEAPGGLCIHCSGMGIGSNFSAELDEWQLNDGRFFNPRDKRVEYIRPVTK